MSHDDTAERLSAAKARIAELEAAGLTELDRTDLREAALYHAQSLRQHSIGIHLSRSDRADAIAEADRLMALHVGKLMANP